MDLVLPDSRLKEAKATVMADWQWRDPATGRMKTIRLELEPIFCFNCGKPNGYVPRNVMSFVSWLCQACSETWGLIANEWMVADERFWATVAGEMLDRFGKVLTQEELNVLAEQGKLGTALEKLNKESPYQP